MVATLLVVGLVALFCLYTIPLRHPFMDQLARSGVSAADASPTATAEANLTPPVDSSVSGSWRVVTGSPEGLLIVDSHGKTVYDGAFTGPFSYTATDPPYLLEIVGTGTIDVWGNISYPVL